MLFRAFHYPPHDETIEGADWAVGKHSDYGYLTLLLQVWQSELGFPFRFSASSFRQPLRFHAPDKSARSQFSLRILAVASSRVCVRTTRAGSKCKT